MVIEPPVGPAAGQIGEHRGARRLHAGLAALLALVALLAAWSLLRDAREPYEAFTAWPRHAATVSSLADDDWVELETNAAVLQAAPHLRQPEHATSHEPGVVRVLVPRPPYLWVSPRDAVDLAIEAVPASAGATRPTPRVALLDPVAWGLPALAGVLLLALLAAAWKGLQRLPWGRDLSWDGAGWVDTAHGALRPGLAPRAGDRLAEPREHFAGTRFWGAFLALATAAVAVAMVTQWTQGPIEMTLLGLGVAALDLMMLHSYLTVRTRAVGFDDQGIADRSFFQTRRVPWSAIASFERVNLSKEAQERYDRDFRAPGRRTAGRMRPRSIHVWQARAADGAELLRLPAEIEGEAAFETLAGRIRRQLRRAAPAGFATADAVAGHDDDTTDDDDRLPGEASPQLLQELAAHEARIARLDKLQRRGAAIAFAAVLAPFLLGTLWALGLTLWFLFGAERAEGTVVEVRRDPLPSLVVAYLPKGGERLLIESDGSDAYGDIAPGQRITVYYDADRPADARLHLFLELWLWPIVGAALCALVALPGWLVWRSMRRR